MLYTLYKTYINIKLRFFTKCYNIVTIKIELYNSIKSKFYKGNERMKNYQDIIACIKPDMDNFNNSITEAVNKYENPMSKDLISFLTQGSKRLRIVLIFLVTRALGADVKENQIFLANGIELMHNASLLHDDVVDNATQRRNKKSFNSVYDNTISIIGGDYLLSLALENFMNINRIEIINSFLHTLKTLCEGEIHQYFHKNTISTIEEYTQKSYQKTAVLYEIAVCSAALLANEKIDLKDFVKNFGIAFQIRDDYNNIYKNSHSTDIEEGIYTAPVIYAKEDYPDITSFEKQKIYEIAKSPKYENLTKQLLQKYIDKAIENLLFLEDNEYKTALIELCKFLEV